MSNTLVELHTVQDLDQFLERAVIQPVVIFKHSLTCGTSAMAFEEMRDLAAGPPLGAPMGLVKVQPARAVSNEVARRFGLRHESPQVLIVRAGKVVWHASHFRVTAQAVRDALIQQHGPPLPSLAPERPHGVASSSRDDQDGARTDR